MAISPGRRPNRNGSRAPKSSTAPSAAASKPVNSSHRPSSRAGSTAAIIGKGWLYCRAPAMKTWKRSEQLVAGEEVGNLKRSGFRGVGAVRAVVLDAGAEVTTQRARSSLGRVGGAHGFAPARDGAFGFENDGDDLPRTHERRELTEKTSFAMHGVKAF